MRFQQVTIGNKLLSFTEEGAPLQGIETLESEGAIPALPLAHLGVLPAMGWCPYWTC
jgi:hypothetical protein